MDDVRLAVIPRPDAAVSGGFGALLVVVQPDEPRLSEPGEITLAGGRELVSGHEIQGVADGIVRRRRIDGGKPGVEVIAAHESV